MKKFISLKIFLFVIMTISSAALLSCRQDDENDFQKTETGITKKIDNTSQSDNSNNNNIKDIKATDPPIKNGTHWKNSNQ